MSAVDQRLLKWGRPTRIYVVVSVLLGAFKGLLLVAQAWLLATIIAGAFVDGKDLDQLKLPFSILLAVFFLRSLVAWAQELAANRCSAQVKSMLRAALVRRAVVLGPMARSPGALVTWPLWLSAASTPWTPTTGGTYLRSSWPRWFP